jgi:hypothetical protein
MSLPFLISGKRVVALRRAMALADGLLDMVECNDVGKRRVKGVVCILRERGEKEKKKRKWKEIEKNR